MAHLVSQLASWLAKLYFYITRFSLWPVSHLSQGTKYRVSLWEFDTVTESMLRTDNTCTLMN